MSFCFLTAQAPTSGNGTRKYVHNLEEYIQHTKIHSEYVSLLGMELYRQYKDTFFRNIPEELVRRKLAEHDYEKVATLEELRELGYKGDRTFAERLYDYYQTDNEKLSPQERAEFNLLRDELNFYAGKYQYRFLKQYRLLEADHITLTDAAERIVFIERMADLVERDESKISLEEFNREEMKDARDYFSDKLFRAMAAYLEDNYKTIVPENPLVLSYRENFERRHLKSCYKYFSP